MYAHFVNYLFRKIIGNERATSMFKASGLKVVV